jgi:predicted lipoprotein with Yx(FWY)xxD motif
VTVARPIRWLVPVALVAAVGVSSAAVSGPGGDPDGDDPATASAEKRTKLKLIDTRYGRILADRDRFALYLFTRDQDEAPAGGREKSRCYGACAKAWPVFEKEGKLRAGAGLDDDLLGTTRRRNGDRQVTYNGHPLYYYVRDRRPEQVLCQDVPEFGGRWYVVTAAGEPVL